MKLFDLVCETCNFSRSLLGGWGRECILQNYSCWVLKLKQPHPWALHLQTQTCG